MTTFKAPFQVYAETSAAGDANAARARTTAAVFNAPTSSGDTATVFMSAQGKVDVSGALKASGTISAGATDVSGALNVSGIVSSLSGTMLLSQMTTLPHTASADTQIAYLPQGSNIADIIVQSKEKFNTSADAVVGTVHLGTSALGAESIASIAFQDGDTKSLGADTVAVSGAALHNVSGAVNAKVTGAGSAANPNAGNLLIHTLYRR
jgi:hypothetical protein